MASPDEAPLTPQEQAEIARTRAAFYAFVNIPFIALPDVDFVRRFVGDEFLAILDALARDPEVHTDISGGASEMSEFIKAHRNDESKSLSELLGVDRTRLYRGVAPGHGPNPPYEAVWQGSAEETVQVLQALAETYRQAGLEVAQGAAERLDYVGIEVDFVRQLALAEAQAWEAGQGNKAAELVRQQSNFIAHHLGRWAPAFIEEAERHAQTEFFRGHLKLLRGLLADDAENLRAEG